MIISSVSKHDGNCTVSICIDHEKEIVWFETTITKYTASGFAGLYKKFRFSTLKAANNKMRYLCRKYGL